MMCADIERERERKRGQNKRRKLVCRLETGGFIRHLTKRQPIAAAVVIPLKVLYPRRSYREMRSRENK